MKFNSSLAFITQWGTDHSANGQFASHGVRAVNSTGSCMWRMRQPSNLRDSTRWDLCVQWGSLSALANGHSMVPKG